MGTHLTRQAATIADVATVAGVSPATVSRVINGKGVDPGLTERVLAAVEELDYRPNLVARSLRTQTSRSWALIITDIENPFFTAIARAVEDVARDAGYSVLIGNTDENVERETEYFQAVIDQRVAGVLLVPSSEEKTPFKMLLNAGIPLVTLDRRPWNDGLDSVLVDNAHGARIATEWLISEGCTRIAAIAGPQQTTTGRERLQGYKGALAAAGLPNDPALVAVADFREDGGYRAAIELLDLVEGPDAFFVANNLMSVGALEAFQERGLRLPHDTRFIGFGEIPWARLYEPELTVVSQPTYEMGRRAAELLLRRIAAPGSREQHLVLKPTLNVPD